MRGPTQPPWRKQSHDRRLRRDGLCRVRRAHPGGRDPRGHVGAVARPDCPATGHPQAAAINVTSWLGVATLGLLWPVALIWAFLRPVSVETREEVRP